MAINYFIRNNRVMTVGDVAHLPSYLKLNPCFLPFGKPDIVYSIFEDNLRNLRFEERNVEVAQRWRSLEENQREHYLHRAKEDIGILDKDTRLKRQMKKIENDVIIFNNDLFDDYFFN